MGISEFLTGAVCGIAAVEVLRECWRRMRDSAQQVYPLTVNTDLAQPSRAHSLLTVPDLLEATIEPQAELTRIERELCKRVGAKPDSNEADVVLHAVRDGYDWNAVLELERHFLFPMPARSNRLARWM